MNRRALNQVQKFLVVEELDLHAIQVTSENASRPSRICQFLAMIAPTRLKLR